MTLQLECGFYCTSGTWLYGYQVLFINNVAFLATLFTNNVAFLATGYP